VIILTVKALPDGTVVIGVLVSTVLINGHHVLYGVSLSRRLNLSPTQKALSAYLLSDGAYALSVASEALDFDFLIGAELSMFVAWNLFTALGILMGGFIVLPVWMPLDFIVLSPFLFSSSQAQDIARGCNALSRLRVAKCLRSSE
jgi:predicted branched-subunit amino acid permease